MIKLRLERQGAADAAFKVPGGFIIPGIGIAAIVWLLTSLTKTEVLSMVVFLSIICIFYFIVKWIKGKQNVDLVE